MRWSRNKRNSVSTSQDVKSSKVATSNQPIHESKQVHYSSSSNSSSQHSLAQTSQPSQPRAQPQAQPQASSQHQQHAQSQQQPHSQPQQRAQTRRPNTLNQRQSMFFGNEFDIQSFYKSNKEKDSNISLDSFTEPHLNIQDLSGMGSSTSINSTIASPTSQTVDSTIPSSASNQTLNTLTDDTQRALRSFASFKISKNSNSTPKPFNNSNYDSTVVKTGWLNVTNSVSNWNSSSSENWRLFKAELKGPMMTLYKLPTDLNIKSFDNTIDASNSIDMEQEQQQQQQVIRHKRLSTSVSRLNLRQESNASKKDAHNKTNNNNTNETHQQDNSRIKLKYFSEVYRHPDLQLNESNSIISGTLESICHTVLFNTLDDDKLSCNLLNILPMFGDIKASLRYFIEYGLVTTCHKSRSSSVNSSKIIVTQHIDAVMTERLCLVVMTIIETFPGMLLDNEISEFIKKLLEIIHGHNEKYTDSLNAKVNAKLNEMKTLTIYRETPYSSNGSLDLTNVENFMKLDLKVLATQINLIDLKFGSLWNPKTDASLLFELENLKYSRFNPLIFNPSTNIHYLGRLLISHLFSENKSHPNLELKRAQVIVKWVELGCHFDKMGDMVSWLAIATVICSIPILRLRKTWSVVDEHSLKIITTEWAPVVFELDRRSMISEANHKSSYHVIAPQGIGETYSKDDVVPYFGDLTVKFIENSTLKQCEKRVQRVKVSFSRWDEYLQNVTQDDELFKNVDKTPNENLINQLYNLLTNHVNLPPLTQDSIMELSLINEPNSTADYYKLHHNSRTPLVTGSYLPIIFSDVIPNYKLFSTNTLLGAGGFATKLEDSNASSVTGNTSIDLPSVELNLKIPLSKRHDLLKSVRDFFNIGTEFFHVENDIIFKSLGANGEWRNSRPTSVVLENPSKRLSQISNHRLSQYRNSKYEGFDNEEDVFSALDNANLLNSLVKPLNVVLNAGTLDKLVDLLVLNSDIFSSKINQADIEQHLTKANLLDGQFIKLFMNNGIYTSTFFATYKSFVTTSSLLEQLGKRFVGAKSAAVSLSKLNSDAFPSSEDASHLDEIFPDWTSQVTIDDPHLDFKIVGQIQLGVLEAILILINDYYPDFTDDLQNKKKFINLLRIMDDEFSSEWKAYLAKVQDNPELNHDLAGIYDSLMTLYKRIRKQYIKKSYRPLEPLPKTYESKLLVENLIVPSLPKDFREAELFVDKLNQIINEIFSSISIADWVNVFQILEVHSGNSLTSFFKFKNPNSLDTAEDDLEILNVFTWLKTLYGDNVEDKILSKFPAPLKLLFEVHDNLEKYFQSQITDTTITQEVRVTRMISLLQILTISRLRMSSVELFSDLSKDQVDFSPHVPSFIESSVTQAIVSPESRAFSSSWVSAATTLKGEYIENWDELANLLPSFETDDLSSSLKGPLTPCIGWFTERLLEVSCYVPNMSNENSKLINFDKRRFTYNCITNIIDMNTGLESTYSNSNDLDLIKEQFGCLFNSKVIMSDEILKIKSCAAAENSVDLKKNPNFRLFKGLTHNEMEKLHRDQKKKETLENQERDIKRAQLLSQVQSNTNRASIAPQGEQLRKLRQNSASSSSSPSKSSSVGRRLGGLLRSVRPFSISVASTWSTPDRVISPSELPDINKVDFSGKYGKPYKQISLFDHKPLFVHSNIDGFFKIVGESVGDEVCFQAIDNAEAQSWISSLTLSKRYTYLSKDSRGLTSSKVFGVPIADVCERENRLIPQVLERLLQEIELRGLDEVGLYRVPGSVGSINLLKQAFDEGGDFTLEDDRWFEINTLAGCFKLYLREMPESLFTTQLLPEFINATTQGDLEQNLKVLVQALPACNYHLLKRLFDHLNKVLQHSEQNRMDETNLAIVFSMSFLNSDNLATSMGSDLGGLQKILQFLIKNPSSVFCDSYEETVTIIDD